MFVLKKICILLSLVVFHVQPEPIKHITKLHCYYSKYVSYFFKLNNNYFLDKFEVNLGMEELEEFCTVILSHSTIMMAMLDELRYLEKYIYPKDLLMVNLYLNNVHGIAHILEGFLYSRTKIMNGLVRFINGECNGSFYKAEETSFTLKKINELLPDSIEKDHEISTNFIFSKIIYNKSKLDTYFSTTLRRNTYLDFHPVNMLFCRLMTDDFKTIIVKNVPLDFFTNVNADRVKLNLLRNVATNWQHDDGSYAIISDLYELVKSIYEPDYVRSYQQQVLAATLHPVLMCATTYIHVIDKIFYPGDGKVDDVNTRIDNYENKISALGKTIINWFSKLIGLNLFPDRVQKYLTNFQAEISLIIKFPKKNYLQFGPDKWIPWLLELCSYPMAVNELQFHNEIESFEIDTNQKIKELLKKAQDEISDIEDYVNTLGKHKEAFHTVIRTINHELMFLDNPLDLLKLTSSTSQERRK